VFVEVGYPCPDGQDECDTGQAVSREDGGDIVNILITLLDADGNPATAGPNGELLSGLTCTVSTTLGDTIEANQFAADAAGVAFGQDATARANIDYTGAIPGTDQVVVTVSSEPDALVGQAAVNVVAPPATSLVVRTLRTATPPQNLYEPIPDQADNLGGWEPAGANIPVTVLAQVGGLYTPDTSLEGKSVIVKAYADYSEDGVAGGGVPAADIAEGYEEDPIAEATFTISGGQVTDTIQINNAGPVDPEGLNVVFTAEIDEEGGISSTLMNGAGLDLTPGNDFTLDTVEMRPGTPAGLLVAMDPYGNGNLVMGEDCLVVFDDDAGAGGTVVPFEVILVDALDNAVLASGDGIDVAVALGGGVLEAQLTASCDNDLIDDSTYSEGCSLQDTDPAVAGQVIKQNITVSSPQVASDQISTNLLPASAPNTLDLTVTVDPAGDLNAGDEVVLTLTAAGDYFPFDPGETLEISAMNVATMAPQRISTSDFASADNTLELDATDDDSETEGLQLPPIKIYGPCTAEVVENVTFTVTIPGRCGQSADSNAINDIEPSDPANLAVVGLADDLETESDLDVPDYVGTDPVVVDTPLVVGAGDVETLVLDCGDLEVRDEFDNVLDDAPVLACTVGLGFVTIANDCDVTVRPVVEAIDTTQTLTCEATDYTELDGRNFSLSMIEAEGEGPSEDATALIARQEAPQDQDGNQILPCGEAIIQILANGTLESAIPIRISFGEGSVEGAEIRGLTSDNSLEEPLPENLSDGEVIRLVIYSPDGGSVNVVVEDARQTDTPLTQGELALSFCQEVIPCDPVVTVTCGATELCDPEEICTTCSAETTCDGEVLEGAYTWELNGEVTTANTIEVCGADLTPNEENILTATDTANENAQGSATLTCGEVTPPVECQIDVIRDSLPKSHWFAIPIAFRIETLNVDPTLLTPVNIVCDSDGEGFLSKAILKTGKVVFPNFGTNTKVLLQTGIILPAWWTQSFDLDSETCTVTVGDCDATDTFELNYLSLGGIPLSE
jgi:hypothetical protein